ncbi:MAG: hypothetical protein LBB39_00050 [Mycoplasmataceae bacterium]|jgi:hypothetical protein|nr:hypothetical protein [Mycoplasmataceae bacterium]
MFRIRKETFSNNEIVKERLEFEKKKKYAIQVNKKISIPKLKKTKIDVGLNLLQSLKKEFLLM